jgi:mRNA-degrading endonuclease RelE of RelBE toxin-antitoxin system
LKPVDKKCRVARILTARVRILPGAFRQIEQLPLPIHRRVLAVLERLEAWPRVSGAKPLRGSLAGRYRMRTGDYRVQFFLRGDDIVVERVGHRDGFYEE